MDHRNLNLEDVSLQYLSNELKNQSAATKDLATASTLARKPKDVLETHEYKNEQDDKKINREIENLMLEDQANFATLQIDLYQPEKVDVIIVANVNQLMKANFGSQLKAGFVAGWELLKMIIIGLANVWSLILIGFGIYFFIKYLMAALKIHGNLCLNTQKLSYQFTNCTSN